MSRVVDLSPGRVREASGGKGPEICGTRNRRQAGCAPRQLARNAAAMALFDSLYFLVLLYKAGQGICEEIQRTIHRRPVRIYSRTYAFTKMILIANPGLRFPRISESRVDEKNQI
jgi:hypothetical protein